MKYKEIIELFKTIVENHQLVNEFGYGNISDINTPEDEEPPNYPYAFLNPVSVSQGLNTATLSMNLIVMTQTYETQTDELTQQSNCMLYLQQIISNVNMTLNNPDVEFLLPYTITPFKERFSDNVVGATANVSIVYKSLLNDCDTPIL